MPNKYDIEIQTSDVAAAGTDENVYINMLGQGGCWSGQLLLNKSGPNVFERNQTDSFVRETEDIGAIERIEIVLGSGNPLPGSAWHLATVKISAPGVEGRTFVKNNWINKGETLYIDATRP